MTISTAFNASTHTHWWIVKAGRAKVISTFPLAVAVSLTLAYAVRLWWRSICQRVSSQPS